MCLYPRMIMNKRYTPNKKNGGQVPPVTDIRTLYVPIGCGNCMECRKQKAREWQVRLQEDIRINKNAKFITLTFSDESIKVITDEILNKTQIPYKHKEGYELDNAIATKATRLFLERWRKEHKKSLRHWLITELGHNGTENVHMHGLIWTDEKDNHIKNKWGYGFSWIGEYVNDITINYIIKYVHKQDLKHKQYKSVILTSAGIGGGYTKRIQSITNKFKGCETDETYRTRSGHKIGMPKYYRNKIYNEEEKEKLWLNKLDQQIRWINGIKIDISKGMEEYWKILDEERKRNNSLKYGSNQKEWEREKYENEVRKIMQETRIKRAKK